MIPDWERAWYPVCSEYYCYYVVCTGPALLSSRQTREYSSSGIAPSFVLGGHVYFRKFVGCFTRP